MRIPVRRLTFCSSRRVFEALDLDAKILVCGPSTASAT